MTLSTELKKHGLTVAEAVENLETSRQTLDNWYKKYPSRFEVAILGIKEKLKKNENSRPDPR